MLSTPNRRQACCNAGGSYLVSFYIIMNEKSHLLRRSSLRVLRNNVDCVGGVVVVVVVTV